MADVISHTEDWQTLPWKKYQRNVPRLQQRIYRAERRGDGKRARNLQRLLLRSWSARCLAVRQVTQENRGKRTAGVDGVASLNPKQRLELARKLCNLPSWKVAPIRRQYIPKLGTNERRGLGIPVMADRAMQALVKLALEPEWEAKFEPNSYGFRPGRSIHDAIEAIFSAGPADVYNLNFSMSQTTLRVFYSAADFVLANSKHEPFGLVGLEAMAAGTPVVATCVDGVPEVVQDGVTGFVVERGDEEAMAAGICHLLADERARGRLGAAGREFVAEQHSCEVVALQLGTAYLEALAGGLPGERA